ncbi:MAG: AAA family ATPase [Candidatus Odinarchaeota archaeon]|nr:AAA family ATPase [Candidatus Odinarchaeota archaeon]
MIITRLKLRDFLSHADTELEFNQGTTVIVGVNGAGKSSILDAVGFALFRHKRGKKLDDLIRKGCNSLSVELDFIVNGRKYRIIRTRRRDGNSDAVLKEITEGKVTTIVRRPSEVDKELTKILNMDSDLFLNAIYVKQGEIAKLLDQDPAERKKLVGRLLQIEEFNKVWIQFKDIISHFEIEVAELRGEVGRLNKVMDDLKAQEREATETQNKLKKIEKTYQQVKQQRDKLRDLYKVQEEKKIKFTRLNSEYERYSSQTDDLKKEIKTLYQKVSEIEEAEKKLKEIKNIAMQFDFLERAHNIYTELLLLKKDFDAINSKRKEITEHEQTIRNYEESFKRFNLIEEELTKIKDERNDLAVKYKTLKEKMKEIQQLQKDVDNLTAILNKKSEKLNALGIAGGIETQIEKGIVKKNTLKKELSLKNEQLAKLKQQIGSITGVLKELNDMMEKIKASKNRCPVCGSKLTDSHKEQILNNYYEKIEKNNNKLRKLQENIDSIKEEIDSSEKLLKELEELNLEVTREFLNQQKEKTNTLAELKKELEKFSQIEEKLEKMREKIETLSSEKEKLQDAHDKYSFAVNALKRLNKQEILKKQREIDNIIKEKKEALNAILKQVGIREEDFEKAYKEAKEAKEEYARLEERIKQKNTVLSSIQDKEKLLDSYKEKLKNIKKELDDLDFSEEEYNNVRLQLDTFEKKVSTLTADISTLKERIRIANDRINELKKEIKAIKEKEVKARKLDEFIELLKKIRDVFGKDGIQSTIRQQAIPIIEAHTREIFQEFGLSYSDIKIDEDFDITLYGPGFEQSVSALSGGEKSVVAFALRMGIARTLANSNLDMIMLDEPTAYLDTYRREELVNVLSKIRGIPQVILVTQEETLKEIADTLIQVDKVGGKSKVKVVEIQEKEGML